jgi:hypothetical protein
MQRIMKWELKLVFGLIWLASGISTYAYAVEQPILVKTNGSGYVPEDYVIYETCSVFSDRVEIERRLSTAVVREVRPITGGASLLGLVKKASQADLLTQDNQICDLPSTRVIGYLAGDSAGRQVLFYETGGCGESKKMREGGSAYLLREFIDNYCPKTHE